MPDNTDIIINKTIDGRPESEVMAERKKKTTSPKEKLHSDPYIWAIYIVLLIVSVIEQYSASSSVVTADKIYAPLISHARFLFIGFILVLICQRIHYKYFKKWAWVIASISLLLLLIAPYVGEVINGAQRVIKISEGITIQPAEIAKITVTLLLASIMAKHQMARGITNRGATISAIVVIVFGGALYSNGLTNTALMMGVSLTMLLIGGIQWKKWLVIILIYGIFGGVVYLIKYKNDEAETAQKELVTISSGIEGEGANVDRSGTHKGRMQRFFEGVHPNDTIKDDNRQVMFANFALANGGLLGNGPGNSRESARLPLAFSDYIFSIIVEDIGFVGGLFLLIIYLSLIARAGYIASQCTRAFPALLITGCAVMIVFQALVHMAIVTGVFPVSGQQLPLISKGGTSILVMSIAIGMMLSVSRFATLNKSKKENNKDKKELPDELQAANPTQILYKNKE